MGITLHKNALIAFFVLVGVFSGNAQDPIFTQYNFSPLQINPAFAGISKSPQFYANYRNQWPEFDTYTTYAVSYDQGFDRMNSGVGVYVMADDAGDGTIRNTQVNVMYSYRVEIDRQSNIRFGLEAGWTNSRLNWSKLIFFDQLDPQFGAIGSNGVPFPSNESPPLSANLNHSYLDVSAGILYYNTEYFGGISFKHINSPDYSYFGDNRNINANLPLRTSIILGYQYTVLRGNNAHYGNYIIPSLLYVRQGDFSQLNAGATFNLNQLILGGHFRLSGENGDAVIANVGWRYNNIRFGYSYDFTISGLGFNVGGSHEIGISVILANNSDRPSRYNDCFAVFR
jgi:type IX secretion system PorP/SprF family membrane protein